MFICDEPIVAIRPQMEDAPTHPDDSVGRYEAAAARLASRLERRCATADAWPQRVHLAVAAALELFASEPDLARTLLVEPYRGDRDLQLRHEANQARLIELLRAGRDLPSAPPLPELVEENLLGAAAFVVAKPLRGEPERLPELAPELTTLLLTPYLGREEAERIAAGG